MWTCCVDTFKMFVRRSLTLSHTHTHVHRPHMMWARMAACMALVVVTMATVGGTANQVEVDFPDGHEELFVIRVNGAEWFRNEPVWFLVRTLHVMI